MSQTANMMDLPTVPPQVVTLDGQTICTDLPQWRMQVAADGGGILTVNWSQLEAIEVNSQPLFSYRVRYLVQLYLADRLTRRKCYTVRNDYLAFLSLGRWLARQPDAAAYANFTWSQYDELIARGFLRWCETQSAIKGIHFSRLRVFYEWGVARQYPDFDIRFLRILKAIPSSANAKGHHVRFRHTTKGPFSPSEKQLLIQAIKAGQGADRDRAVVMIHLELGLNPGATARLTNADFVRFKTSQGDFYQLAVPRIKKRAAHRETKRRPISTGLGQLLQQLQQGEPQEPLLYWLPTENPQAGINTAMRQFVTHAGIISPRTGEPLQVTARRFRYTLATHLAAEGASKFHIAEVLDHTDLQNVEVYVETTPAITDQVATATDAAMMPVVNRFLGKIAAGPEEMTDDHTANSAIIPADTPHIPLPMLNAGGVGVCGRNVRQDGLCQLFPPLSCYLCPSFMAWRNGPHQALLTNLDNFIEAYQEQADSRILR
jgi:integrase